MKIDTNAEHPSQQPNESQYDTAMHRAHLLWNCSRWLVDGKQPQHYVITHPHDKTYIQLRLTHIYFLTWSEYNCMYIGFSIFRNGK